MTESNQGRPPAPSGLVARALNWIETVGNKLPDPAVLFLILLLATWVVSALLANVSFTELDPRTGSPIQINNQLTGPSFANFLATMGTTFTGFHPLGATRPPTRDTSWSFRSVG